MTWQNYFGKITAHTCQMNPFVWPNESNEDLKNPDSHKIFLYFISFLLFSIEKNIVKNMSFAVSFFAEVIGFKFFRFSLDQVFRPQLKTTFTSRYPDVHNLVSITG